MDWLSIADEDSCQFTILGKIGADTTEFHGGNGNCGWAGAGDGFSRDGCGCAEASICCDFIYLSKLDREYCLF
jgi:hypothetical protein